MADFSIQVYLHWTETQQMSSREVSNQCNHRWQSRWRLAWLSLHIWMHPMGERNLQLWNKGKMLDSTAWIMTECSGGFKRGNLRAEFFFLSGHISLLSGHIPL
jgi:hypothetical protein